ncbi:hypothetical protein [Aureispira sp. CCB-QB1]|uniref:hypothetical protein n=1 Tax=Aureispira sp. CCB-QB1 TaxID=1313421 RepID=UPI0006980F39|nr:hypothetical protein [Aureispira sp. CCB-QB1]
MRVEPSPQAFTVGAYNITNETLNFERTFQIRKTKRKPIGVDVALFAIHFKTLDANQEYWYYPDQASRDADFLILDAITNFDTGSDPTIITKLQELIDKPDFESVLTIGIDSDSLEGIVYDTVTSETYGVGGGTVPTIVQEEETPNIVEWTSVSNSHRLIVPFNYGFQAENMSLYFEFETLATNIDQNRYYFYFQKMDGGTPTTILTVSSDIFRLGRSNGSRQIIELKYDNSLTNYQDFRLLIQPFASNVNYPATYRLKALGVLPSNFSYDNLVKELLSIENNIPTGTTYLDTDNNPKNLTGVFLPTSNFPSENSLKETLTTICENLVKSDYEKIIVANDYTRTTTYLDEGDAGNRRIHTIVHSSTVLGLTVTETFAYAGSPGDYYVSSMTRA